MLLSSAAASTVLSAVYGWPPIKSKDDPIVTRINDFMHRLVRSALPGAYLVEIFPVMKRLPTWAAPWKKWGLDWYRKDSEMFQGFYEGVAETVVSLNVKLLLPLTVLTKRVRTKAILNPRSHHHLLNIRKSMDCRLTRRLGLRGPCCMSIRWQYLSIY